VAEESAESRFLPPNSISKNGHSFQNYSKQLQKWSRYNSSSTRTAAPVSKNNHGASNFIDILMCNCRCGKHITNQDPVATKNVYNYALKNRNVEKTPMCRVAELARFNKVHLSIAKLITNSVFS
jgi:hypothetical protein